MTTVRTERLNGMDYSVLIAGGGPTGLMLAAELALAGVNAAIVERRSNQEVAGSRAGGLHARTLEVLDQRGIADRFVGVGQPHPVVHFHVPLDLRDCPTRYNYTLALWQSRIESLLAEWVAELGVPVIRGTEVQGFAQDETGVQASLCDGRLLRAEYLVGCDGGRSVVRKTAGIEFSGANATTSWLLAEVRTTAEPVWGFRQNELGTHAIGKAEEGRARIVLTEATVSGERTPDVQELREALIGVYGTDFGAHDPAWLSRFTDRTRQAATYRNGRVLLAGDAAHIHPPVGGQGLNLGVQDAVNLGWKLAQVVKRTSTESLLDTYHLERHPVGARVLRNTMALVALRRPDARSRALAEYVAEFLQADEPRNRMVAEMTALDIHYELGEACSPERHPLLGRRMPDLDIVGDDGPGRVYTLLHEARPVLLNFGARDSRDASGWLDRIRVVDATYRGAWKLPAIGTIPAPDAVLIRPDGYVAWVDDGTARSLAASLAQWFGPPSYAMGHANQHTLQKQEVCHES
jgi:3-(3-hydroxy-phenyl)propionate hydroxylase